MQCSFIVLWSRPNTQFCCRWLGCCFACQQCTLGRLNFLINMSIKHLFCSVLPLTIFVIAVNLSEWDAKVQPEGNDLDQRWATNVVPWPMRGQCACVGHVTVIILLHQKINKCGEKDKSVCFKYFFFSIHTGSSSWKPHHQVWVWIWKKYELEKHYITHTHTHKPMYCISFSGSFNKIGMFCNCGLV